VCSSDLDVRPVAVVDCSQMKKCRLYQVDSFTTDLFQGNPAGVVPDADGLTAAQMQAIAREMNNSETAFILSPIAPDHEVWIRFFTPTTEVPSCGHATIAAHYVRAREMGIPSCTIIQKIGAGILPVEIIREEEDYRIVMTQGAIEFGETFTGRQRDEIIAALGIRAGDLNSGCPVQIVSTGHSKVLVGIREWTVLDRLQPDMARLTEISPRIRCNGYFVFALVDDPGEVLSHGRMFAPAIGIPEDPVTGNANGPLGAYLVRHQLVETDGSRFAFKGQQGEAIGRLGTVEVEVEIAEGRPAVVRVGGRAVIVFKSELTL
jgi:PhzF family phenazine biosynthesis protein